VKLLVDMNISPLVVAPLNAAGHSAIHWASVGPPTASDASIMSWARAHEMVLLTHDLDFGEMLAASGAQGPSVIQLRAERLAVDLMCRLIVAALRDHGRELELGALMTLDTIRDRVRLLPINRTTGFGLETDLEDL
jgi:predicted nuclease of predicted toxin-antitoxin system